MCQVLIDIPNEVLYDTHMNSQDAVDYSRKIVALAYYTQMHVSLGYCAQIAGMTKKDFILFLGQNNVSIFQFDDEDDLVGDINNA